MKVLSTWAPKYGGQTRWTRQKPQQEEEEQGSLVVTSDFIWPNNRSPPYLVCGVLEASMVGEGGGGLTIIGTRWFAMWSLKASIAASLLLCCCCGLFPGRVWRWSRAMLGWSCQLILSNVTFDQEATFGFMSSRFRTLWARWCRCWHLTLRYAYTRPRDNVLLQLFQRRSGGGTGRLIALLEHLSRWELFRTFALTAGYADHHQQRHYPWS